MPQHCYYDKQFIGNSNTVLEKTIPADLAYRKFGWGIK